MPHCYPEGQVRTRAYRRFKGIVIALLILNCLNGRWFPLAVRAAEEPQLYGVPWTADSLGNLEIGRFPGRMVSYRFRANYSGEVDSLRIFLVFRTVCPGCYANGNGGQVLLLLETDDGTESHFPSGKALASCLITDPMKQWNRLIAFDKPVRLEKGALYHFVFSNPAPDPVNNYVSVDDLYHGANTPGMQPGIDDTDLAVLFRDARSPWQVNYKHTPIFSLNYTDGRKQGVGYIDCRLSGSTIAGSSKVRETFKVSGPDKTATRVSVRLKKTGKPGDLTVRLELYNGRLVEEGRIQASSVSTNYSWVTYKFRSTQTLKTGQRYNLLLSAPPGDGYRIFPMQKGKPYGFESPENFTDGFYQVSADTEWQGFQRRTDFDMQFYFTLAMN